ncbi:MAG: VWA domain-containing protein [Candidatus Heimdallarchaeaceae archaeon]
MSETKLNPNIRALTHWHSLLGSLGSKSPLQKQMSDLSKKNDLPEDFMNSQQSLENLKKQFPDQLKDKEKTEVTDAKMEEKGHEDPTDLDEAALIKEMLMKSKNIQDLFTPSQQNNVKSADMHAWKKSTEKWKEMVGKGGKSYGKLGGTSTGSGFTINKEDIEDVFYLLEAKMVKKMSVIELLKDEELHKTIDPSIHLVEELLYEKHKLSGVSLVHAKALIKKYVLKVGEVLKHKVEKAIRKIPNPDIVPKKIFRNLNLKRTIWKNLPNWEEEEQRLFVDKLIYYRAGKKTIPTKIIIVVDQSGSMVDAMVQSVILASVFSGLPNTDIELFAFDTRVVNLTKYVNDPLEALMQTRLGGGTHINLALMEAKKSITDPKNTALVLITDYYEGGSDDVLFNNMISMKEDGVKIISLASMNRRGHVYMNSGFVNKLKNNGIKTIHGNFDKLIDQLKKYL